MQGSHAHAHLPPSPTTILRPVPLLPPHLAFYDTPPPPSLGSSSTSRAPMFPSSAPAPRTSSKTRRPTRSPSVGKESESGAKRGRTKRPPELVKRETSHSRTSRLPRNASRGGQEEENQEEDEDEDEMLLLLESEVKPKTKRVKVGARASIACSTCRRRKVRCSGEWPSCKFCAGRDGVACVYDGHPLENGGGMIPATSFQVVLPSIPIILEAVDYFFLHNYDTLYFLHRPSLINFINDGSAAKEMICCILAFAAKSCQSLKDLHPDESAADHYASLAAEILLQPLPPNTEEISLMRCQVHLMLGLFECCSGSERGWMLLGIALRQTQILRLAYEDEDEMSSRDPIAAEIRRRTYWACFLHDRLLSDGRDRPVTMRTPLHHSIRLPGSETDFLGGRLNRAAKFESNPAPWTIPAPSPLQMTIKPAAEVDINGLILRASDLWSRIAGYVGAGGRASDRRAPWLVESTFAQLDMDLMNFKTYLPVHFRYSESNLVAHCLVNQGRQFGLLTLLLSAATLVLHRDYLPFLPTVDFDVSQGPIDGGGIYENPLAPRDWWMQSFTRAIDAATIISDLGTRLADLGSRILHPFAGFSALAASTIHLHIKYWPKSCRTPINVEHYLSQDLELLAGLRSIYPIASSWVEGFSKLQALYHNIVSRGTNPVEIDPRKVRSSVIKLLRTVEDQHSNLLVRTIESLGANGSGSAASSSSSSSHSLTTTNNYHRHPSPLPLTPIATSPRGFTTVELRRSSSKESLGSSRRMMGLSPYSIHGDDTGLMRMGELDIGYNEYQQLQQHPDDMDFNSWIDFNFLG